MARQAERKQGDGWLLFAAVMMFVSGFQNIIYGITALAKDGYLTNHLLFQDLTFWGWLWLSVGIAEILVGVGVAARNQVARWIGVVLVSFNAIGQLAFLAAFPFWSMVIIAVDILIVYGLVTYDFPTSYGYGGGWSEPYPYEEPSERPVRRSSTVGGGTAPGGTGQTGMGQSGMGQGGMGQGGATGPDPGGMPMP